MPRCESVTFACFCPATSCGCWVSRCRPWPSATRSFNEPARPWLWVWSGWCRFCRLLALALIAGHLADRFDRRLIIMATLACTILASVGLAVVSLQGSEVWAIYLLVAIIGVARGFSQPARSSFLPQIVSRHRFPNAITWSTGAFQLAFVLGPR